MGRTRAMTACALTARPVATPSLVASSASDCANSKRHRRDGRCLFRPLARRERFVSGFAFSSRRGIAAAPNALSDPVEVESKAERFLREQLEREGIQLDAVPETPEEIVAALQDEAFRLAQREAALSDDLDKAYRDTFADLVVEVPREGDTGDTSVAEDSDSSTPTSSQTFTFPEIDEAGFRQLTKENAAAAAALLETAQKGDQEKWLAFQRNAHRAKLTRDRVRTQLAAVQAEANVARNGGGAVAAAAAARKAAAAAAAAAAASLSDGIGGPSSSTSKQRSMVLISGFESFNVKLYRRAARNLKKRLPDVSLFVFSDRDLETNRQEVLRALQDAEVFFGSLLFDFDQVEWLRGAIEKVPTKFVFESALELMSETQVGSFEMKPSPDGRKAGPPPAVAAVLKKFGSGKEEVSISQSPHSASLIVHTRLTLFFQQSGQARGVPVFPENRPGTIEVRARPKSERPAELAHRVRVLEPRRLGKRGNRVLRRGEGIPPRGGRDRDRRGGPPFAYRRIIQ